MQTLVQYKVLSKTLSGRLSSSLPDHLFPSVYNDLISSRSSTSERNEALYTEIRGSVKFL